MSVSGGVNLYGDSNVGVDVKLGAHDLNSNYQMNVTPNVNANYQMNVTPNVHASVPNSVMVGNPGVVQVGAPAIDQETPYHLCGKPYPIVSSGIASCSICLNLLYPGFGTYIIGCKGSNSSSCCFWFCMGKDLIYYFRLSSILS